MINKILKCGCLSILISCCIFHTIAQTTLILQPGATAGKDAFIHSYSTSVNTNFGNEVEIPSLAWTINGTLDIERSFIKFNLTSIPASSTILAAYLSLYAVDINDPIGQHSAMSGPNNAWIERVTASWDESTITWNNQPAVTLQNRVELPASGSPSQNYIADVTQVTQDILNASVNFGFRLKLDNESNYRRLNFYSSDCSIPSKRPKLVVTYCAAPPATISFSGPANVCVGDSVILNANSGAGYTHQWNVNGTVIPGATSVSYPAKTSGLYTVHVTNASGCTGFSAGVTIMVGNQFTVVLQPDSAAGKDAWVDDYSTYSNLNFGSSVSLVAWAWTAGGTPFVARSLIEFNLSAIPPNSTILSAQLSLYGEGQHSTLSGSNEGLIERVTAPWDESTVTWNNQPPVTTQNSVLLPASSSVAQDYPDIDVTNLINDMLPGNNFGMLIRLNNEHYYRELDFCSSDHADSTKRPKLVITYGFPDTAFITASGPVTFCNGSSVLLSANPGNALSYQWKKNGTTIAGATGISYYANSGGSYTVTVTSSAGCSAVSSPVPVVVNPLPSATVTTGGPATFCSGESVLLNAPVGSNRLYQWKKNGIDISGAVTSSYNVNSGGVYKVRVTNTLTGCVKTSSNGISVTVNSLPSSSITPQGPTTFCAGGSVVLAANTGTGLTYKWKKGSNFISGATLSNYTATTGGNYKVQVTNSNGCSKTSANIVVSVPCKSDGSESVRMDSFGESAFDVKVFPNPSSGDFVFEISNATKGLISITIYDVIGKLLFTGQILNPQFTPKGVLWTIRNSQLSPGVYTAVFTDRENKKTLKLIKTN